MSSLDLLRIEYKLDLLLHSAMAHDPVLQKLVHEGRSMPLYATENTCPLCEQEVRISVQVSAEDEGYSRTCGCHPPVRAVAGLSQILKPKAETPSKSVHVNPPPEGAEPDDEPEDTSTRSSTTTPS